MPRQLFIVLTNAEPGRSDEYNDWHDEHLGEVVAVPGILSGQRFRVSAFRGEHAEYQYLTLYEIDVDDPGEVIREIQRRADSGTMVVSKAMSPDLLAACYVPITPVFSKDDVAVELCRGMVGDVQDAGTA